MVVFTPLSLPITEGPSSSFPAGLLPSFLSLSLPPALNVRCSVALHTVMVTEERGGGSRVGHHRRRHRQSVLAIALCWDNHEFLIAFNSKLFQCHRQRVRVLAAIPVGAQQPSQLVGAMPCIPSVVPSVALVVQTQRGQLSVFVERERDRRGGRGGRARGRARPTRERPTRAGVGGGLRPSQWRRRERRARP